jgi:RNA polymerase sigma-70 factor, ECF subfamily
MESDPNDFRVPPLRRPTEPRESDEARDLRALERLGADDSDALEELLDRYWFAVVAYLGRLSGSDDVAQDLAQEVFCRLWDRRGTWRAEGSVRGLIFRLAHNLAISDHRRRQARDRAVLAMHGLRSSDSAEPDGAEREDLRTALERAIGALPKRRREVFLLRCVHELSYREIAEAMGTSTQTVANQLSHALAALRRSLRDRLSP